MNRSVRLTACLLCAAVTPAAAHTLDEYVQALRVSVTTEAIVLHVDLTPGVTIAAGVSSRLDRDGDGRLSSEEAEAYGREVVADLRVMLDGVASPVVLTRVDVPATRELLERGATIRVEATLAVEPVLGRHELTVHNAHRPAPSVYLANALLPATSDVQILRQTRDTTQQTFVLAYQVDSPAVARTGWLAGAGGLLLALVGFRTGPK